MKMSRGRGWTFPRTPGLVLWLLGVSGCTTSATQSAGAQLQTEVLAVAPAASRTPLPAHGARDPQAATQQPAASPPAGPAEKLLRALKDPGQVVALELRGCPKDAGKVPPGCSALSSLPPEIRLLTNLESLDLADNELTALPEEIGKLVKLKRLKLARNKLESLPPAIKGLKALEELDLDSNPIKQLPPEIGELEALTRLVIARTDLRALPPQIGKLANLLVLDAYASNLVVIPDEFSQLGALKQLDLTATWIVPRGALPPVLGSLASLEDLRLRYTHTGFHKNRQLFQALTRLRHLDVEGTNCSGRIAELRLLIPEVEVVGDNSSCLFCLGELKEAATSEVLTLTGRSLTRLPPEFSQFVNLRQLDLSENKFTQVPPEVFGLRRLEILRAQNNRISTIPEEMLGLERLEVVNLEKNRLTKFPAELLDLPNLKGLLLGGNRIDETPSTEAIEKMRRLEVLTLDGNRLTPPELMAIRKSLPKNLTSSWGGMGEEYALPTYTYAEALKSPERVQYLDMVDMGLERLPDNIIQFTNLEVLYIQGNPITSLTTQLAKMKHLNLIDAGDTLLDEEDVEQFKRLNPQIRVLIEGPSGR